MEKKEQLLIIEPQNELKFRGPFNTSVTSHMRLTNPTDKQILFKIKTTAPKKYCVRPNCGALEPKCTAEVAICLQPFIFNPNEKNKHKFMVQSLIAPEGEINIEQLWKEINPEQLMDSKLRCVFELPIDNSVTTSISQSSAALINNEISGTESIQASGDDKIFFQSNDGANEFVRATAEMRQLREEESQLRQENLQLKEQLLRLRTTVDSIAKERTSSSSTSPSVPLFQNPYSPPQQVANQHGSMFVICVAFAIGIVGILLGKLLF